MEAYEFHEKESVFIHVRRLFEAGIITLEEAEVRYNELMNRVDDKHSTEEG